MCSLSLLIVLSKCKGRGISYMWRNLIGWWWEDSWALCTYMVIWMEPVKHIHDEHEKLFKGGCVLITKWCRWSFRLQSDFMILEVVMSVTRTRWCHKST